MTDSLPNGHLDEDARVWNALCLLFDRSEVSIDDDVWRIAAAIHIDGMTQGDGAQIALSQWGHLLEDAVTGFSLLGSKARASLFSKLAREVGADGTSENKGTRDSASDRISEEYELWFSAEFAEADRIDGNLDALFDRYYENHRDQFGWVS